MKIQLKIIEILSLFCVFTLAFSVSASAKVKQNKLSDNITYSQAFFQVVGFDKEANKTSNELDRLFYKNYFKQEAKLTEEGRVSQFMLT